MNTENAYDRSIVELVKVTKVYPPDVVALQNVSVSVKKGEMVFLTGVSGSGKTTFLKLISCIERPTKGLIEVDGRDLSKITAAGVQRHRQRIGVAYQDFKLLDKKTVFQNIAMPMEVTYADKQTIKNRITELLDLLDLAGKAHIPVSKLSRGEQQRVTIARAAANAPPLLLADEPTGNLDRDLSLRVLDLFKLLNKNGTTVIIATHDEYIYRNTDYRILDINKGQLI